MAKYKAVLLDRPAWYVPTIEEGELARVDAEVIVGWARLGESRELEPEQARLGLPPEELSLISDSYVAGARHTLDVIVRMASDADAVFVNYARLTAEVMDRLPRLRVIGRPGIGYDVVDVEAATARGIALFNAPGFCAREVADHTLMLALALARKAPVLHHAMRRGRYDRSLASPMRPIYEMTLGLVGFGEIAREVAVRAKPFGFTLLAHDPYVEPPVAARFGATLVGLPDLLARADIVSVHAPLMQSTFHLLGEREFALMKPTAYLINTARGPVVDEAALIEALKGGRIAGAGLDVFEHEPLETDSALLGLDNVLLTPHTAAVSDTSLGIARRRTARNVAEVLVGHWPETRDLVNPQVKDHPRRIPSGM